MNKVEEHEDLNAVIRQHSEGPCQVVSQRLDHELMRQHQATALEFLSTGSLLLALGYCSGIGSLTILAAAAMGMLAAKLRDEIGERLSDLLPGDQFRVRASRKPLDVARLTDFHSFCIFRILRLFRM